MTKPKDIATGEIEASHKSDGPTPGTPPDRGDAPSQSNVAAPTMQPMPIPPAPRAHSRKRLRRRGSLHSCKPPAARATATAYAGLMR